MTVYVVTWAIDDCGVYYGSPQRAFAKYDDAERFCKSEPVLSPEIFELELEGAERMVKSVA